MGAEVNFQECQGILFANDYLYPVFFFFFFSVAQQISFELLLCAKSGARYHEEQIICKKFPLKDCRLVRGMHED